MQAYFPPVGPRLTRLAPCSLPALPALPSPAQAGGMPLLELLLQAGAHADAADVMRRTPLMYAVIHDQPDQAKHLLRRAPPPPPLCWAAQCLRCEPLHGPCPPQHAPCPPQRLLDAAGVCLLRPVPPAPPPPPSSRRGAACTRDRHGLTVAQLAAGRECGRDAQLAELLARGTA